MTHNEKEDDDHSERKRKMYREHVYNRLLSDPCEEFVPEEDCIADMRIE